MSATDLAHDDDDGRPISIFMTFDASSLPDLEKDFLIHKAKIFMHFGHTSSENSLLLVVCVGRRVLVLCRVIDQAHLRSKK